MAMSKICAELCVFTHDSVASSFIDNKQAERAAQTKAIAKVLLHEAFANYLDYLVERASRMIVAATCTTRAISRITPSVV